MTASRPSRAPRLFAVVALAYVLALQGLLGALGAGAQAGEARLAAQLGVICTIHGPVDPATGKAAGEDPTPGKLACVEHCALLLAQPMAGAPSPQTPGLVRFAAPTPPRLDQHGSAVAYPPAAPAPGRGPPAV